jgi:hypothetical protein
MSDEKEKLAAWMIKNSFATGHGDTFDDLLKELTWQVNELRQQRLRGRQSPVETRRDSNKL